jgi:parvulin-like peptidyl-prolyl isomerase
MSLSHFFKHTLILFSVIGSLAAARPAHGLTVDRVLATVGNETITFADYQQFIKGLGNTEHSDAIDETLFKKLIEEKIILNEAKRKGIDATDSEIDQEIEEFKEQSGLSQKDFETLLKEEDMNILSFRNLMKDKIMILKLISEDVDSKVVVMDKEVEDFYTANKKSFINSPETVEIEAIFLRLKDGASVNEITDLKRKSLKIAEQLKDGESFKRLVSKYSDEPLRSQNGLLGTFEKGALLPSLDEKAFLMEKDEVSDPIWVSDGVYILHLINKSDKRFKPIKEVKDEIRDHLYKEKREKMFNDWIKALWDKASVIIKLS